MIEISSLKRPREHVEEPPMKRMAVESLELSDNLSRAKGEFASIIDQYMRGNFDEEIDTNNEFIQANVPITSQLRRRERLMTTRDTVLCASNPNLRIADSCLKKLSGSRTSETSSRNRSSTPTKKPKRCMLPYFLSFSLMQTQSSHANNRSTQSRNFSSLC